MKRNIIAFIVFLFLSFPSTVRADIWGGDVAVLVQILANAYQQLTQLQSILGAGKDTLGIIRDINRGINDSLNLLGTIAPNAGPGVYGGLAKSDDALRALQQLYGIAVPSSQEAPMQSTTDQTVAEAIAQNNSIYTYTNTIDPIGESIKSSSHSTSPGGAAKLTAESLGVMLNVMNESLRAQATGLKLQAQSLEVENKKDKDMTRHMISDTESLKSAMKSDPADFSTPRF
ncbi:MAG: hypothetical protein ACXWOH_11460 [Bdellovibrionota bacterium]